MSKLTNYQIRAQIARLAKRIETDEQTGLETDGCESAAGRRRIQKLAAYREELAQREAAGLNPGTDIQDDLRGKR